MNILKKQEYLITLVAVLSVFFFYYFDVGNLNAIRQGTEPLYMNIAQEMYDRGSFLAPYYKGEIFWTKPPMHFWLAFPFNALFGGPSTLSLRVSIVTLALAFAVYASLWLKKRRDISFLESFLFLSTSVAMIRYSRIYMMEMPLMVFGALTMMKYFDYQEDGFKIKDLILSSLFAGAATLVKGPVSLVMSCMSLGAFHLAQFFLQKKAIPWKNIFIWFFTALFFSSLWFIACYAKYGFEFINYFFIRENLGKFTSKAYSPISIVEGLIVNLLPWTLLLIPAIKNFSLKKMSNLSLFLILCFCGFYFIWFIPKQRSHHYAIPAIPFMLFYLWINFKESFAALWEKRLHYFKLIFPLLTLLVAIVSLWINKESSILLNSMSILLSLSALYCLLSHKNFAVVTFLIYLNLGFLWTVTLPTYYLPIIPGTKVETLKKLNIRLSILRPFFFQEILGNDKIPVAHDLTKQWLKEKDHYLIVSSSDQIAFDLLQAGNIVERWPKWRSDIVTKDVIETIKKRDIKILQEEYLLLENNPHYNY